jgi:hypothetical protein
MAEGFRIARLNLHELTFTRPKRLTFRLVVAAFQRMKSSFRVGTTDLGLGPASAIHDERCGSAGVVRFPALLER